MHIVQKNLELLRILCFDIKLFEFLNFYVLGAIFQILCCLALINYLYEILGACAIRSPG